MLLSTLDLKLLREIKRLKGQILTIALVLAGGIACFISLRGTYLSLDWSLAAYYDRYRFADVFAHVERAPESLRARLEALDGVASVETRISEEVTLPIEGQRLPAYGRILSLPASGVPAVNAVHLRSGRMPERSREDEALVVESFARAHGLRPGHRLSVVINGKLRELEVVGIVLSPEFVYAIRPGAIVDDPKRYAVLWMERRALAPAFDLDGAFNDVVLRLQPGAPEAVTRAALDRVLAPYGSDGAYARKDQISHKMLTGELGSLRALAGMVPLVFLGVAAFLINLVLNRLIRLQRPEIATLKAVGYTNAEVGRHYLGLVSVVLLPGAVVGVVGGWALGERVLALYATVFNFPDLDFRLSPTLVTTSLVVSAVAAVLGALFAVRAAVRLPPAEAMRPPPPARYRRGVVDRLRLGAVFGTSGLMVLREVQRRPLRTALSALGIGGAIALIILGRFGWDSLNNYLDNNFRREQRQDLAVTLSRPVSPRVIGQLERMPGVLHAEGLRAVPVRARFQQRMRDTVLLGLPEGAALRRLLDRTTDSELSVPPEGVILTKTLAEVLGLRVGDKLELELREGDRAHVHPVVVGTLDEAVGLWVYARSDFVATLEHDLGATSQVLLKVDPQRVTVVEQQLRRSPYVIDVSDVRGDVERLRDMNAEVFSVWTFVSVTLSACVIFGVVYNNARIALAARSRDLASLRVLGFTRAEISSVLIGALAIEVALAIPIGLYLGKAWGRLFMRMIDQETFRWSVVVTPSTYVLAAAVALLAAGISALWVRRNLDHLDLIAVLKTRE